MKELEIPGYEKMSIETINDGAVLEQANDEIARIIANILDVNTEAEKTRELTVKIKFKPDADRNSVSISHQATSKTAPDMAGVAQASLAHGRAWLSKMHQMDLGIEPQPRLVMPEGGEE